MKKIFLSSTLGVMLLSGSLLASDIAIQPSALPQKAQQFIKTYFAAESVSFAEKGSDDFGAKTNNGVEFDFAIDGEWHSVKSYAPIKNLDFLPKPVVNLLQSKYAQNSVHEIERKISSFEIKLNNGLEISVGNDGTVFKEDR
ncbi:hypothetical protein CCZ01_05500 [Helicobacter monodelphidis]|uniref:PepSY-like domain-containing protein n=1 Tax=Helicobacter sp. 15-1451 TaxID=2004995 RepID=UPI000DCDE73D|nr:PepSY-like domain-containing protein [Helicobacter sp. 15-1451]RAX57597.1 hypothetical protein CCZ01_05500 [Helicobacter sp. 15-1451]